MKLSPLAIKIILHCHTTPEPLHDVFTPVAQEIIGDFVENGLLEPAVGSTYTTTERGRAFVAMLCATPFPEQVWRNPVTKEVCDEV